MTEGVRGGFRRLKQASVISTPKSAFVLLVLFTLVHMTVSIDRSIIGIALEPIRREFGLKDVELGLFGMGFALFFGMAGLPLGRLVDRVSRKLILSICLAFFSAATLLGGVTQTATQLLVTRFAVGAGEAGGHPAMLSMLSDVFPLERRASATSIYYLGIPLAVIITYVAGGWVVQTHGWRSLFVAAGVPGLILSAVIVIWLREPRRGGADAIPSPDLLAWRASLKAVLSKRAMLHIYGTTIVNSFIVSGVTGWMASFFVRTHGLTLQETGFAIAVAYGGFGTVATLGGGWVADRAAKNDIRWRSWTNSIALMVALAAHVSLVFAPSALLALACLCVWALFNNSVYGPAIALCQSLAPASARGTAAALFYFLANFVGAAGGPPLIGWLSDALRGTYGQDSLRYAFLCVSPLYLWSASHFFFAGRRLEQDLAAR